MNGIPHPHLLKVAQMQALRGAGVERVEDLADCDLLVDALFGMGGEQPGCDFPVLCGGCCFISS